MRDHWLFLFPLLQSAHLGLQLLQSLQRLLEVSLDLILFLDLLLELLIGSSDHSLGLPTLRSDRRPVRYQAQILELDRW